MCIPPVAPAYISYLWKKAIRRLYSYIHYLSAIILGVADFRVQRQTRSGDWSGSCRPIYIPDDIAGRSNGNYVFPALAELRRIKQGILPHPGKITCLICRPPDVAGRRHDDRDRP